MTEEKTETLEQLKILPRLLYVETIDGKPRTDIRFTCHICGSYWQGFGNNPDPLGDPRKDRCCTPCNTTMVLPARLGRFFNFGSR